MRKADNLPPSCAVVTKSGNINFLEPSGPLQACNGRDLPLYLSLKCPENIKFNYNLARIVSTLHEDLCTFMTMSRRILFGMRNFSEKKTYKINSKHTL